MHFAIVFTTMLCTSSLIGNGNVNGVAPFLAFPGAIVGFILAGALGILTTFVLVALNPMIESMFRIKISAGHVAAVAGGLTGFACSLLIAECWRLFHCSPGGEFYDLQDVNLSLIHI